MRSGYQLNGNNSERNNRQIMAGRSFQNLFGTYRGVVRKSNDTFKVGFVRVYIPFLHNTSIPPSDLPMAYVVQIYGGGRNYGSFYIPPVGSTVFVQFEDGDPRKPLIVGTWYGDVTQEDEKGNSTKITEEVPKSIKNCFINHIQDEGVASIDVEQPTQEKEPYDSHDASILSYRGEPRNLIIKSFKGHVIEMDDTGIADTPTVSDGQSSIHNEGIRFTSSIGQIIHIIDQPNKEGILIKNMDEISDGVVKPGNYIQIDQANKNINIFTNNNFAEEVTTDSVKHVGRNELSLIDKNKETVVGINKEETIGGNWTVNVTGNIKINVIGSCIVTSGGPTMVQSGGNADIVCNGSVTATADGPITLNAPLISLNP